MEKLLEIAKQIKGKDNNQSKNEIIMKLWWGKNEKK